jgi:renal tumor antigen
MLFECLKGRPLFPGKHEIDQIARIHNLLGTPSLEVLSRFRKNPNSQIEFAFPQRSAQDFMSLLPNASPETISLLRELLAYDPLERITAQEALLHPAFEVLRAFDHKWSITGKIGSFSSFVTENPVPIIRENRLAPIADSIVEQEQLLRRNAQLALGEVVSEKPRKYEESLKAPAEWILKQGRMRAAERVRKRQMENIKTLVMVRTSTRIAEMPRFKFGVAVIKKIPVAADVGGTYVRADAFRRADDRRKVAFR